MIVDLSRRSSLYGRRKGHALRPHSAELMDTLLPRLALDLTVPPPMEPGGLFPNSTQVEDVWLEIGFGAGEHLDHQVARRPDIGFIGCEPFVNGMAKALRLIEAGGYQTVRLHHGDALDVLDWLPAASLGRVYLLYPDPWPKRRHWKRRFINADNLDRLARVMRQGAELRFASDIDTYVSWTLCHLRDHDAFEWTARRADDWREPWPYWPGTRYEAKSFREGRTPTYLTFRRLGS